MNKFSLSVMVAFVGIAHAANAEVVAVRRAAVTPMITVTDDASQAVAYDSANAPMPLLIHGVATEPVSPSTVLLIGVLKPATPPQRPPVTTSSSDNTAPPATETNASGLGKAR